MAPSAGGNETDDYPEVSIPTRKIVCDNCGSRMRPVGGCWFCPNCGQKKCNTDIT